MIFLFSDIHLTDTMERSTFDAAAFIDRLSSKIEAAARKGLENITVVMLGDIFEVLKSSKWLKNNVRPWQECRAEHVKTVEEIMSGIIDANSDFFNGVRELSERFPACRFEYIPGNHDRPLNTSMGLKARILLQKALPFPEQDGEAFQEIFIDPEHKLIARHGHEWDSGNRYGDRTVPFGDAIVIDLILRLPLLVAERMDLDESDPLLDFLYEVDNIRPHTLRVISQWIYGGLGPIKKADERAYRIIDGVFKELAGNLLSLAKVVPFESFKTNSLRRKVTSKLLLRSMKTFGALNVARLVHFESESDSFRKYALRDFRSLGKQYQYIVCGHTHHPKLSPLDAGDVRQARLYINTGTWRRVRPVSQGGDNQSGRKVAFSCWDEECVVSVFTEDEQSSFNLPAYDFQRWTRGR